MAEIKLYLDEDISNAVATVLRSRGLNVASAHDVGMRGKTDKEQLEYAIENGRTLITFNAKHFAPLVKEFYEEGKDHFGVVISRQIGLPEMIRLLVKMVKSCQIDDLKNSLSTDFYEMGNHHISPLNFPCRLPCLI